MKYVCTFTKRVHCHVKVKVTKVIFEFIVFDPLALVWRKSVVSTSVYCSPVTRHWSNTVAQIRICVFSAVHERHQSVGGGRGY